MASSKITPEQSKEIADRIVAGESRDDLAEEFGVSASTIAKHAAKHAIKTAKPPTGTTIAEFAKRARSILWREDKSQTKKTYDAWTARVDELESEDGGGYSKNEAIVRASKEFPCLHRLFREYDVAAFDPNPGSHPKIKHFGSAKGESEMQIGDGELSYRDAIRWAMDAAGRYMNGEQVATCPCSAAFYLYKQAIESPRDFLQKVGQIEAKAEAETQEKRVARKANARQLSEIEFMLDELDAEENGDGDID